MHDSQSEQDAEVALARARVEAAEMAVLQARMQRAQVAEQASKVCCLCWAVHT